MTDYFVRLVRFPNFAADGVTASNGDGTFSIYINDAISEERRRKAFKHEIDHIENDDFHSSKPIEEIEHES